ncbi:splicing factor U2AF 35 kDa subunit-like isoform X2 [Mytilus californianus]|uniref:splicing factor U2AF 35 kDa subunit-like isoform X2 n=1 Tax=Mytilus californianus TaxID=6549 RepID=UPI0022475920|nr:splicing factor U2AF 35 kDa subunit-like isoform X2 [Mytilus californianus]
MAEYLASIFGTEKDKVNCSFYFKIGACRHGERCSRLHNKPTFSQTVVMINAYLNPQNAALTADGSHIVQDDVEAQQDFDNFFEEVFTELEDKMDEIEIQQHYDEFFEEIYVEMEKYGEIEEMNVCDNLGDHLVGNVYIKFRYEEDAEKAVNDLNNRWFNGRPIHAELSPVTDFREACCRQYEMGECTRGGFCNFMHLKPISRELRRELYGRSRRKRRSRSRSPPTRRSRSRSAGRENRGKRSRSRERRSSRSRSRERGGGGGGGGHRRDRDRHGRY